MGTFALMAVAALGLSACTGEKLVPDNGNADGKFVTVYFGAEAAIEGATKATLTTADELTFKSAWENGGALSVEYSNDNETVDAITSGVISATWATDHFEAELPKHRGVWFYDALYPAPNAEKKVDFGSARTQNGSDYNSKYDLMKGGAIAENADAGKTADGQNIVFNMTRQTAIAYFHLASALDEEVVSAKLSVEGNGAYLSTSDVQIGKDNKGNTSYAQGYAFTKTEGVASKEINLTFDAGTAPKTSGFKLWFNVLPTDYDKMTLTVETANHTLTISRNATGKYEAGKLYKVVKDNIPVDKWVKKGGETPEPTSYVWDLSIDSTSEASNDQIGWTNDAADMLCVKGKSTTAANNYYHGKSNYSSTRFYTNSTLSITPKVGKSLYYYVFKATTDDYAKALVNSTWTNATASVDAVNAEVVYIVATDPTKAVSAKIGATCGFTKVECHTKALSLTPVIKPASTSITVPSNGGEQSITYTIQYPEDGKTLTAVSPEAWINSINCGTAGTVSFVAEENVGAKRNATITLSYPGAEDVAVTVSQSAKGAVEPVTIIVDASDFSEKGATTSDTDHTFGGVTFTYSKGAKKQAVVKDAKNAFSANNAIFIGKSGAYIYNKTAIPGVITKFEIYSNKGASAQVEVGVNFSNSAISKYNANADNTYTAKLATVDKVYDCSASLSKDAKYFRYQVTNDKNSQVQFRITYIPEN